jgi:hypothetical protein
MRSSQFTREVRLDDGQVGDFRRALGCLGRANLRMGPPQPFPLAVSGKITQIFLETQVIWGMSAKWISPTQISA